MYSQAKIGTDLSDGNFYDLFKTAGSQMFAFPDLRKLLKPAMTSRHFGKLHLCKQSMKHLSFSPYLISPEFKNS